jgi:hypothetical protein
MTVWEGTGGGGEAIISRLSERDKKPLNLALPVYMEVSEEAVMVRALVDCSALKAARAGEEAAMAKPSPFNVPLPAVSGLTMLPEVARPSASFMLLERGVFVAICTDPISGSSSFQNELSDVL